MFCVPPRTITEGSLVAIGTLAHVPVHSVIARSVKAGVAVAFVGVNYKSVNILYF